MEEDLNKVPVNIFYGREEVKKDPQDAKGHRYPYFMGIELELENVRSPLDPAFLPGMALQHWTQHNDESLRNGIEFVTDMPLAGNALVTAVDSFYAQRYRYTGGPRTSTHVHVNAGDTTIGAVRTMFVLSYILENALFQLLEAKRKWCGYCMPLTEMSPKRIRALLSSTSSPEFERAMMGHNAEKYYGFNVNSIRKHGTVEFRYFPGAPSKDELLDWLDYCTAVKRVGLSTSVEALSSIPDASSLGAFLTDRMGRWGARIVNSVGEQALYDSLLEVVAHLPATEGAVRRDELVFISKPLISYIANKYCRTIHQRNWLVPKLERLQVVTASEWYSLLEESTMKQRPPKAARRAEIEEAVEVVAQPDWDGPLPLADAHRRMQEALRAINAMDAQTPLPPYRRR